jgi:hypothetical protein
MCAGPSPLLLFYFSHHRCLTEASPIGWMMGHGQKRAGHGHRASLLCARARALCRPTLGIPRSVRPSPRPTRAGARVRAARWGVCWGSGWGCGVRGVLCAVSEGIFRSACAVDGLRLIHAFSRNINMVRSTSSGVGVVRYNCCKQCYNIIAMVHQCN